MFRRAGLATALIAVLIAVTGPTAHAGVTAPDATITSVDSQIVGAGPCTLTMTYSWTAYTTARYVDVVMRIYNPSLNIWQDVATTAQYTRAHRSGSVTFTVPAASAANQSYYGRGQLFDRGGSLLGTSVRELYTDNVPCTPTG